MGTVLFAWELGGGLGHVGPMKVLAEALAKWGHQPVFAVKDVISARPLLGGLGPVLQAPVLAKARNAELAFGAGSLTDILAMRGFANPKMLGPACDAWSDLVELVRPDLLVADYSPTATLVCRSRLPVVSVGYGFYLPPDHLSRFPAFREDVPPVTGERAILASMQEVLAARGLDEPKSLPAAFRADYTHVYSLPMLDPYAAYRRTPGFGPIEPMPGESPAPEARRVFAYLQGESPRIVDALLALEGVDCPVELFVRNGEESLLRFASRRNLLVHREPAALPEVMARASLVVSHGGGGITHAALLAGRPQAVMPLQAEAHGTAAILQSLGVGRNFAVDGGVAGMRQAMLDMLANPKFAAAACAAAASARATYHPDARLKGLIEICNELAYASRGRSRAAKPQRLTSIP